MREKEEMREIGDKKRYEKGSGSHNATSSLDERGWALVLCKHLTELIMLVS